MVQGLFSTPATALQSILIKIALSLVHSMIMRASNSLPVPASPSIRTGSGACAKLCNIDIIGKIAGFINPIQRMGYYADGVQVQVVGIKGVRKMQESPIALEGIEGQDETPYGGF